MHRLYRTHIIHIGETFFFLFYWIYHRTERANWYVFLQSETLSVYTFNQARGISVRPGKEYDLILMSFIAAATRSFRVPVREIFTYTLHLTSHRYCLYSWADKKFFQWKCCFILKHHTLSNLWKWVLYEPTEPNPAHHELWGRI